MKFVCPLIVVEDIRKSREFYETILEQHVEKDYGENLFFGGGFAIHQKKHFQTLINGRPVAGKSNSLELYFEHDQLHELAEKIEQLGLEFVHKIAEQPWKQLVMRFYDYDGNLIEVGESLDHTAYRLSKQNHSIEEICKITYLDRKSVEMAIRHYSGKAG
jgi:catechol 2,3-dioxygenase-like lactoylglutathione lyase family enzyme